MRTIAGLKAEADDLKGELRNRGLEINDLETDENTLKNQLDQRNIEIEKLKAELHSLFGKYPLTQLMQMNLLWLEPISKKLQTRRD